MVVLLIGDTMKKIFNLVKKLIYSFLLLYNFNMILLPININIPINIVNMLIISFLGIPSFVSLILILFIAF